MFVRIANDKQWRHNVRLFLNEHSCVGLCFCCVTAMFCCVTAYKCCKWYKCIPFYLLFNMLVTVFLSQTCHSYRMCSDIIVGYFFRLKHTRKTLNRFFSGKSMNKSVKNLNCEGGGDIKHRLNP